MLSRRIDVGVGLVAAALALLLLFVVIPYGVVTPRRVRLIVLSPLFWPTILGGALLACGLFLAIKTYLRPIDAAIEAPFEPFDHGAVVRLGAFTALILLYYLSILHLGMILASIAASAAMIFITRSRFRYLGLLCALLLPLALYAFFYHVAGVPVPQGVLVRLP